MSLAGRDPPPRRPQDPAALASRYTGLFRTLGATPLRPHDPDVAVWAGVPANRPWPALDAVGGAGWTDDDARLACVGEAIERWHTHPLPTDGLRRASFAAWTGDEPAIDPARFVRYAAEQHEAPGFVFERLDEHTELDWVACRTVGTGEPIWAPADLVYLDLRPGRVPRFGPTISTGLAAHATPQAALEAALLEVIERDALVGAWWGGYPLFELDLDGVWRLLGDDLAHRLQRRSLRFRFYRIATPRAGHVAMATVDGEDREGRVFSIGSACRLDRRASLAKAVLEAVQGRHYVRYLLTTAAADPPTTFAEHAVYYSHHPERLAGTVLEGAARAPADDGAADTIPALLARLPPLAFRLATPPVPTSSAVVRVIAPELQPLHGDHRRPFLGGPLWNRPLAAWATMPPHPFA